MVSSLNCPACGAPAPSATAARCEYCGSALTVTACPQCFGPMFAGMDFCPHCGAKGSRVLDEGATLPCPGCKADMRSVRVGTTQMHECAGCSSTWLEAEAFTQLCTNREDRGAVTALVDVTKTPTQRTVTGTVRYVSCPTCHKTMNRQNFGKRSGVIIDVCKGHGVWFEHGELQSVLAFVDSGGLERARAADKERDAEEHRKLDRTAADAMMDRMRSGSGWASSPSESKSWLDDALRSLFS